MSIIRWDPFRNVAALQDRINRMFDDAFERAGQAGADVAMCDWAPPVDIHETAEGLFIEADLPGVEKEDVLVEIKDNVLTLRGERRLTTGLNEDQYIRKERCAGSFHRAFNLQFQVKPESIRASFKNGVLQIVVPKPEEEKVRQIKVSID
jgi:HSP20 family protein